MRVDKPDNNLPLKIIVHGWNNYDANSDGIYWAVTMKNAILENVYKIELFWHSQSY